MSTDLWLCVFGGHRYGEQLPIALSCFNLQTVQTTFFFPLLSLFSVTFTSWNNPGRDVMDARVRAREQAGACGWRRGEQFGGVQKQNAFVTSWNGLLLPGLYIACSLQITSFSFCGRFQCWQILKSLKFAKNAFPFFLHFVSLICIFLLWSLSKMIQVTELL